VIGRLRGYYPVSACSLQATTAPVVLGAGAECARHALACPQLACLIEVAETGAGAGELRRSGVERDAQQMHIHIRGLGGRRKVRTT
jgi:hypothetical protein